MKVGSNLTKKIIFNPIAWLRHNYIILTVIIGIAFPSFIFTTYGLCIIQDWQKIETSVKSIIMETISAGTLSLGALSLVILSYSFSEIRSSKTTIQKAPYRRLAIISYILIFICLTDAFTSIAFLLTAAPFTFELSITLFFIIVIGLIINVIQWVIDELVPKNKKETIFKALV